MPQPLRIAVAGIVKNEAPYLLEWIGFHRATGVDRFFVADNESDDGSTELLAGLAALGVLVHIPYPDEPGVRPQVRSYREILKRHRGDADWIAFIDADEFILPMRPGLGLRRVLAGAPDDVGAIALNWAIYGSSGLSRRSSGLVVEAFRSRAPDGFRHHRHYKTIVRTTAAAHPGGSPHNFFLKPGFRTTHANYREMAVDPALGAGISAGLDWSTLRLNHYVVKSRAEFLHKKSPRGSATSAAKVKRGAYFKGGDRNDVEDPVPCRFVDRTREEIARLKARLRAAGVPDGVVDADLAISSLTDEDPHGVFDD